MNLPFDSLPGRALIHDRDLIRELYTLRVRAGQPWDEVWDGLLVLLPVPDNDHQDIRFQLAVAIERCHPHAVYPGGERQRP